MQTREIYGLIGAIFGMTGLFLFILWIGDFVPFVRFSVAVLLLGAGVWAVGVAAGLRWGEVFAPLRQSLGQALAGLTPAPSAAAASPWRCPRAGARSKRDGVSAFAAGSLWNGRHALAAARRSWRSESSAPSAAPR
jgi:hypothetical protein